MKHLQELKDQTIERTEKLEEIESAVVSLKRELKAKLELLGGLSFGDNEDKLLQDINALKEKIGEHETKANAIREARETAEKLINNVLLELKENTDLFEKQLQESYNKIDKVKEAYNTEIKAEKETRNEMYKSYNIYLEEVKQALQPYMQEKEIQRIGYIKLPYKKDLNYITSYGTL